MDTETPDTPETAGTTDAAPAAVDQAATETSAEPQPQAPADEVPQWARRELEKVRSEAAGYRTRLRDVEQQLETRVSELTSAQSDLERQVLIAQAARRHQLPDDLAALVQGADAEAIEAHAATLARYAGGTHEPGPVSGGLNPTDTDEGGFDPVAVALAARAARY